MHPRCVHTAPNALQPPGLFKRTAALPLNKNFLALPVGTSSTEAIFTSFDVPNAACGHRYFKIAATAPEAKSNETRPIRISANFLREIVKVILSVIISLQLQQYLLNRCLISYTLFR